MSDASYLKVDSVKYVLINERTLWNITILAAVCQIDIFNALRYRQDTREVYGTLLIMLELIQYYLEVHPYIAPVLFILIRMMPILIPPIPGLLLDGVGIALFGWKLGFILAETAVLLSSMIAFYIARYAQASVLERFVSLKKVHEWENKFSEKEKFLVLLSFRFVSSPFFDVMNYAAGLTKIKASAYFWTTLIVTFPMGLSIYYFGDIILNQSAILILSVFLILIPLYVWWDRKKKTRQDSGLV